MIEGLFSKTNEEKAIDNIKKISKKLKKEDKKIKEIIKIVSEKHDYSWEKEGKEVSMICLIILM